MAQCLQYFPQLNIKVYQTCLSRASELLEEGRVQLALSSRLPVGAVSHQGASVPLSLVVAPDHPLLQQPDLTLEHLVHHSQVIIQDAGTRTNVDSGWLGASCRVSVANVNEALEGVMAGLGFAWLPLWLT